MLRFTLSHVALLLCLSCGYASGSSPPPPPPPPPPQLVFGASMTPTVVYVTLDASYNVDITVGFTGSPSASVTINVFSSACTVAAASIVVTDATQQYTVSLTSCAHSTAAKLATASSAGIANIYTTSTDATYNGLQASVSTDPAPPAPAPRTAAYCVPSGSASNYTVFTAVPVNATFLQLNLTVPFGYFVVNTTYNISVVGTDAQCANNIVLAAAYGGCFTETDIECLTFTGGFPFAPAITVDYTNGNITYTYTINPSDTTIREQLGLYIDGNNLYSNFKTCQLVPQSQFGVQLPFNVSDVQPKYAANLFCHTMQQALDIEIETSGTISEDVATIRVSVLTDGTLSWTITDQSLFQSCAFTTTPNNAASCEALSCTLTDQSPSYTLNISAVCTLADGTTKRTLPTLAVDGLTNQYFQSYITAAPLNGQIYVYGSTDTYNVIVMYYISAATVAGDSETVLVVQNDAVVPSFLEPVLTNTTLGYRNLTFTPGALLPGNYNISFNMLYTTKGKFRAQQADGQGSAQRSFTVVINNNNGAGSPPTSSKGSLSVLLIVVICAAVGLIAVIVAIVITRSCIKNRSSKQVNRKQLSMSSVAQAGIPAAIIGTETPVVALHPSFNQARCWEQ